MLCQWLPNACRGTPSRHLFPSAIANAKTKATKADDQQTMQEHWFDEWTLASALA